MSLNALLQQTLETSKARFPVEAQNIIASAAEEMRQMNIEQSARGVGDYLPSAVLKNASGDNVALED